MENATSQYEYQTYQLNGMNKAADTATEAVAEMAEQGWDLQATIEQAGTTSALVFKRPK